MNKRVHGGDLQWFDHMEGMKNARIAMKVYVGVCAGIGRLIPWRTI